jgi:hypothetical protein
MVTVPRYLHTITAAHDTTRGTVHHLRAHGRIDEEVPKIELTDGSTAVSSTILDT